MDKFAPKYRSDSFRCPHCQVVAVQSWRSLEEIEEFWENRYNSRYYAFQASKCYNCIKVCIWHFDSIIFPKDSIAPHPHLDIPDDVKNDYIEARNVFDASPRSSAALLRLGLQKLCKHLGEPGKNINADIGGLVKKGLPVGIQQAFDVVRVVGNNAVHPGEIEVENDPALVLAIFDLMNMLVEKMISEPKQLQYLYDKLPDGVKTGIEKRDS